MSSALRQLSQVRAERAAFWLVCEVKSRGWRWRSSCRTLAQRARKKPAELASVVKSMLMS